jgi:hypothetical protein
MGPVSDNSGWLMIIAIPAAILLFMVAFVTVAGEVALKGFRRRVLHRETWTVRDARESFGIGVVGSGVAVAGGVLHATPVLWLGVAVAVIGAVGWQVIVRKA